LAGSLFKEKVSTHPESSPHHPRVNKNNIGLPMNKFHGFLRYTDIIEAVQVVLNHPDKELAPKLKIGL
jgi:hypothetical protein